MPDLTRSQSEAPAPGQRGIVTRAPAAVGDPFEVTVPDFSGDHFYEITRWQSRGSTLPALDDEVLVLKDDQGEPWVSAWWPADGDDPISGGGVESFEGRTGEVTAQADDYDVSEVTNAASKAEVAAKQDAATAATDTELAAHAADTTAIHGITDTSKLAVKSEVEAKQDASTAATDAELATEKSGREAADATEKGLREAADKAEKEAREAADALLASKTELAALLAANDAVVFKGVIDCSASPNYPAADAGHLYRVSVAGKIGGASGVKVEVGDMLLCLNDGTASGNQATVGSKWNITQANIDGAVIGPASAASGNLPIFSGITGKIVADSGYSPSTFFGAISAEEEARAIEDGELYAYIESQTGLLIPKSILTTKGDLLSRSASELVRVGVGANGTLPTADSTATPGWKWAVNAAITKLEENGLGVVVHGAEAGKARPAGYLRVVWIGSVEPTNALSTDIYLPEGLGSSYTDWGLVTALPSTPSIGDVCKYWADKTNGIIWDLIYDGEGEYPWKKIGGPPLRAEDVGGIRSTKSATPQTTGSPSIAAPLKGEYRARHGARYITKGEGATLAQAGTLLYVNGTNRDEAPQLQANNFEGNTIDRGTPAFAIAATQTFQTRYYAPSLVLFNFNELFVEIDPIRVG